jgi:hypothetical protein
MPPVPVHDIEVKNADLVIATHGRGFWILDDISPLRQYSSKLAAKNSFLFQPEDHTRFGYNWWMDYGGGPPSDEKYFFVRNAEAGYTFYERGVVNGERKREFIDAGDGGPLGVIIYYLLSDEAKDVSLTILDEAGNEIRTFGKDKLPTEQFSKIEVREYGGSPDAEQVTAGVGKGLNRFIWDMRYPSVSQIPGRPPVVINPIAKPGTYQVRLTVDGKSQTQSFELKISPNETYTRVQTDEKGKAWMALYAQSEKTVQAILKGLEAKEKAAEAAKANPTLKNAAAEVAKLADSFEASMVSTGTTLVQIISEPTKPLAFLTSLHNLLEHTEGPPNKPWYQVFEKYSGQIDAKIATFDAELKTAMEAFE